MNTTIPGKNNLFFHDNFPDARCIAVNSLFSWDTKRYISFGGMLRRMPFLLIEMAHTFNSNVTSLDCTFNAESDIIEVYGYVDKSEAFKIDFPCPNRNSKLMSMRAINQLFAKEKTYSNRHTFLTMDISTTHGTYRYSKIKYWNGKPFYNNCHLFSLALYREKSSIIQRIMSIFPVLCGKKAKNSYKLIDVG